MSWIASFTDGDATSQPRASESGALLNVVLAGNPGSTLNFPERGILNARQVYVTRNGFGRPSVPAISEYHLVSKPLSLLERDLAGVVNSSVWFHPLGGWCLSCITSQSQDASTSRKGICSDCCGIILLHRYLLSWNELRLRSCITILPFGMHWDGLSPSWHLQALLFALG